MVATEVIQPMALATALRALLELSRGAMHQGVYVSVEALREGRYTGIIKKEQNNGSSF